MGESDPPTLSLSALHSGYVGMVQHAGAPLCREGSYTSRIYVLRYILSEWGVLGVVFYYYLYFT